MPSIYPQQNNYSPKTPSPMDYDLQAEKQRIAEGTEEIKKELLEKWNARYRNAQIFPAKVASASREMIDFLLSFQNTLFYNDIAGKFSLSQQQRDVLPQVIWNICLNKNWDALDSSLQTNLKINSGASSQIASLMSQTILQKAKELSTASPARNNLISEEIKRDTKAQMTISDALKAYPELGEQLITSEKIKLRSFPEPVRPSIKNWLADYTFTIGFDNKDSIKRGNYLFHNANTSRLSSDDRQRLAYVLKAYDEETPVMINENSKKIVFEEYKTQNISRNTVPAVPRQINQQNHSSAIHNTISYSSPQKLSYETNIPQPIKNDFTPQAKFPYYQQSRQTTPTNNVVRLEPKPEPPKELPKNVVNLREL